MPRYHYAQKTVYVKDTDAALVAQVEAYAKATPDTSFSQIVAEGLRLWCQKHRALLERRGRVIGEVNYGNGLYGIVATVYHGDGKPVTYHYCLFAGGPEKPVGDLEEYETAAEARAAMDAKARALDAERR